MHVIQLIRADFSALIKGCVRVGVCGKQPSTAKLRDELVYELIRLAETAREKRSELSDRLIPDGLFTTLTNVNFDDEAIKNFTERVKAERIRLGGSDDTEVISLFEGETDIVSLRSTLLFGMKGMAAYAHHAMRLGHFDDEVTAWFYNIFVFGSGISVSRSACRFAFSSRTIPTAVLIRIIKIKSMFSTLRPWQGTEQSKDSAD